MNRWAEVVNLRRARKRRGRIEAAGAAAEHRARFGRTRAERQLEAARKEKSKRELDGLRISPGGEPE